MQREFFPVCLAILPLRAAQEIMGNCVKIQGRCVWNSNFVVYAQITQTALKVFQYKK